MLELNRDNIEKNADEWKAAGVALPRFDSRTISENTVKRPRWVHFGAGNIFRGYIANIHQDLLDSGKADTGITAVGSYDYEVIDKVYNPFDNLTLYVQMNRDGKFEKKVVGSIVEALATSPERENDLKRLREIFENPSLQMVSFTITEKGYALTDANGENLPRTRNDYESGPATPLHAMSVIASMLYGRFRKGAFPLTLVSMDNCSRNGDKLKESVLTVAREWLKRGFVESEFIDYLEDEKQISFPLSMIDKIVPRPSSVVSSYLGEQGIGGMELIETSKKSYIAPFVNGETSQYLVIEDKFTNGRPPLEEAGVIFTDRETVNKVETMKVTTCLNPLHTALAISGCLLGYSLIADEMKDEDLRKFVEKIGYDEGLKVVVDPGIVRPKDFLDEVLNERFANPFIPDSPQRIATDTSLKVGIRFGETIKSYVKRDDLDPRSLVAIPLVIALWCRYILGLDDEGKPFAPSSDPQLETLQSELKGISLGDSNPHIDKILSNENIFGSDLYKVGLGDKITGLFTELIAGKGAIRKTLKKYIV